MSKILTILFIPIDAVGHVNAALGMAQVLIDSGHRVVFVINEGSVWRGRLINYGIEEKLIPPKDKTTGEGEDSANKEVEKVIMDQDVFGCETTLQSLINVRINIWPILMQNIQDFDRVSDQLFEDIKPDVMILDQLFDIPSVIMSGIPWVLVSSCNPLIMIDDERTPMGASGMPAKGHELEIKKFKDQLFEASFDLWKSWNSYIVSKGVEPLEERKFFHDSKYLNVYGFPLELDYLDLRPLPPKWFRFDNLKRTEKQSKFEIPDQLKEKPGQLIYFSMGTIGDEDLVLLKRLVAILAKSPHRFIVSKGTHHDKYELFDNMWGQKSVPQLQVLSTVDLVITHGGNNTVTETFFFGKPMIVMPMFVDQFDNAQRIHELGFGIRLNPYLCTEEQLLNAIESLLNDKQLNEKLKNISKRIQTDNSIGKLPQLIESLVK